MDINGINGINAGQRYTEARAATQPAEEGGGTFMRHVAADFAETLARSEDLSKSAMVGDADPHALIQALAQTELAVETAVTVRNKVVEAYQEILRMPV